MKRKLLSILALLCLTVSGAWADDYLYIVVDEEDNTKATLMYGNPDGKPYYNSEDYGWYVSENDEYDGYSSFETLDVNASCADYYPDKLSCLFNGWEALTTITNIGNLKTDNVTDMHNMFSSCEALSTLDLSSFDTSNVTDMQNMFDQCNVLETLDLSNFNTSNVTNMYGMFLGCEALSTLDLSNFNTSKVTNMYGMFWGCSALESLDISNFNTSNVTKMEWMFASCEALKTLDLSSFNTSNVTDMLYMFDSCESLTTIYVGDNWNTDAVEEYNRDDVFSGCTSLPNWDDNTYDLSKAHVLSDGYLTATTVNLTANEGDTGEYWATFYNTQGNYLAPEGTQVFKVNLNTTTAEITMTPIEDRIVNKNEGVVLKKTTSGDFTLTASATASNEDDYSGNSLQGRTTSITNPSYGSVYVLNKGSQGVGLYKLSAGGTIGANKAYLTYTAGAREFFLFDEATGIESATLNDNVEMTNDNVYDLQGRRVSEFGIRNSELKRGLYIVNGKKVIIK